MKGVMEYIDKHGNHFTRQLVEDIMPLKWNVDDIMDSAQKRVYYNVTGSTDGDMAYITQWLYDTDGWPKTDNKTGCINRMLWFIGNYEVGTYFFCSWLFKTAKEKKDFDFTPYI